MSSSDQGTEGEAKQQRAVGAKAHTMMRGVKKTLKEKAHQKRLFCLLSRPIKTSPKFVEGEDSITKTPLQGNAIAYTVIAITIVNLI